MVLLRIEDHDRQRSRRPYESALLDDLDRLAIEPDEPSTDELRRGGESSYRQSDSLDVYGVALQHLRTVADVYSCDCTRARFAAWRAQHGTAWTGAGCPGDCRRRGVPSRPGLNTRVALGRGDETWQDAIAGKQSGAVSASGDLPVRDRNGNWTYGFCVVIDDLRHGVNLVVRGQDLLGATPDQIRLGSLLGRTTQPTFAHHPLVLRPDGSKLSKAAGDTAVGELLDSGRPRDELFGLAAAAVGLLDHPKPISFSEALELVP
jgi:glutamyl/glutaminyl-tRNA synthetase